MKKLGFIKNCIGQMKTKKLKISSLHFPKNCIGQMKIQQMAFMLIAVTLFFALAGLLVLSIYLSGLKDSASDIQEENALLLVSKLANSPEFSCEESFSNSKANCVDSDKAIALTQISSRYSEFWGVENIEIKKISSNSEEEKLCDISNYPDCNTIKIFNKEISGYDVSNFVVLCRKELLDGQDFNRCEIARLIISYNEN